MPRVKTKYREKKQKNLMIKEEQSLYAHQVAVSTHIKNVRKDYGIFFTPDKVIDFMVSLIDPVKFNGGKDIFILEPACGLAQFLLGIKRNRPAIVKGAKLFGVEINQDVINYLKTLNIGENIELIKADYLLWHPGIKFDLIIGNPPYGIPSLSEHYTIRVDAITKEKYKKIYGTWYGKYNVYGAFIEQSIKLLQPEGQLIFIVPATFMILDEFKKLRTFLSQNGRTTLIYLGPDVFKPEADVASVILDFYKSNRSTSRLKLLEYQNGQICPVRADGRWHGEVVKFETDYTRAIDSISSYILGDVYEIRISPRTPEIKHSPYVIKERPFNGNSFLPLLNGRNLKCNKIVYDNLTGYWIKKTDLKRLRVYLGTPHIVVGLGFREGGKVAAANDERCYPWMGDIYHLIRRNNLFSGGFDLSDSEVLEYLNSEYLSKYVKNVYREITYHLSITQLKNLPLPAKKEWHEIKSRGIYGR